MFLNMELLRKKCTHVVICFVTEVCVHSCFKHPPINVPERVLQPPKGAHLGTGTHVVHLWLERLVEMIIKELMVIVVLKAQSSEQMGLCSPES